MLSVKFAPTTHRTTLTGRYTTAVTKYEHNEFKMLIGKNSALAPVEYFRTYSLFGQIMTVLFSEALHRIVHIHQSSILCS